LIRISPNLVLPFFLKQKFGLFSFDLVNLVVVSLSMVEKIYGKRRQGYGS